MDIHTYERWLFIGFLISNTLIMMENNTSLACFFFQWEKKVIFLCDIMDIKIKTNLKGEYLVFYHKYWIQLRIKTGLNGYCPEKLVFHLKLKNSWNDELLLKMKFPARYELSGPNKGFPLKAQLTINLYYNFFRGMLLTEVISAIIKVK